MSLVTLHDVHLHFGGPDIFDGASFGIERGERVCLVGRNGAGKSTLLKLVSGETAPDSGTIYRGETRLAVLPQDVPASTRGTVREVLESGLAPDGGAHQIESLLTKLRLDGAQNFEELSGGSKRRALLGRALASDPDLLLLDEPTNHLDIESIAWLEDFLLKSGVALLFVSHDRTFLKKLATRLVELDRGQLRSYPGDYDNFLLRRAERLEIEDKQNALFDKNLAAEEVWVRKGIKARTTRNEGRVRALKELRRQRSERQNVQGSVRGGIQESDRSGARVAETFDASFSYDASTRDAKPIIRDLNATILRGDKVGIIGPNGAGKTTLLRLLLGQLQPTSGAVKTGTKLEIAYFDQMRAQLDENASVAHNVSGGMDTVNIGGVRRHIVGYLGEWLFSPERARTPVSVLSGGERNRVLLAKLFTQPSNVLVMDEPTNDLDIETLDLLEDLLVDYAGTLLLVSHDRDFLNNVATSTLAYEGDGAWREYPGGYDDWLLLSRRQENAARVLAAPKKEAAPREKSLPEKPRKMSFKERDELEKLPARLEKWEEEKSQLYDAMGEPETYKNGAAAQLQSQLETLEATILAAYARWEELEKIEAPAA